MLSGQNPVLNICLHSAVFDYTGFTNASSRGLTRVLKIINPLGMSMQAQNIAVQRHNCKYCLELEAV